MSVSGSVVCQAFVCDSAIAKTLAALAGIVLPANATGSFNSGVEQRVWGARLHVGGSRLADWHACTNAHKWAL